MLFLRRFISLSILSAVDALRQPICLLLTLSCVCLTALTPMVLLHQFGEYGKVARDSGLAYQLLFGMFVVGCAASSSLSKEVRSGTASVFLCKPISRHAYFWSKYAGLLVVIAAFTVCASTATLLAERVSEHAPLGHHAHKALIDWQTGVLFAAAPFLALLIAGILNFRFKQPFELTAYGLVMLFLLATLAVSGCFDRQGSWSPLDFRVEWRILPVSLIVSCALAMFAALALSLSTRLNAVPTLSICLVALCAGLMSDYAFGRFAGENPIAALCYGIVPNWQHLWVADALLAGGVVPVDYVTHALAYSSTYALSLLMLGTLSFSNVDLK